MTDIHWNCMPVTYRPIRVKGREGEMDLPGWTLLFCEIIHPPTSVRPVAMTS